MLSTRDPPQNKEHIQTESEGLEKDIPHRDRKKAGVAILIPDKIVKISQQKLRTKMASQVNSTKNLEKS